MRMHSGAGYVKFDRNIEVNRATRNVARTLLVEIGKKVEATARSFWPCQAGNALPIWVDHRMVHLGPHVHEAPPEKSSDARERSRALTGQSRFKSLILSRCF